MSNTRPTLRLISPSSVKIGFFTLNCSNSSKNGSFHFWISYCGMLIFTEVLPKPFQLWYLFTCTAGASNLIVPFTWRLRFFSTCWAAFKWKRRSCKTSTNHPRSERFLFFSWLPFVSIDFQQFTTFPTDEHTQHHFTVPSLQDEIVCTFICVVEFLQPHWLVIARFGRCHFLSWYFILKHRNARLD